MLHLAVVEFNVNLSPLAPPPPFIYLFYGGFFLSLFCHREKQSASEEQGQQ